MSRRPIDYLLRCYVPQLAITLLSLGAAAFYSLRAVERLYTRRLVDDLKIQAFLAGELLLDEGGALLPSETLQERTRRLGAQAGQRWTVLTPDRVVVADSEGDMERIARDRHALRPEIQAAYTAGTGSAMRRSATVDVNLLYVARRIERGGRLAGVIRLAVPTTQIEQGLRAARGNLRWAFLGVTLLALAVGLWSSHQNAAPVDDLRHALHQVARGDLDVRVETTPSRPLHEMGGELNSLAQQMQDQIEALAVERGRREAILASMSEGVLAIDMDRRVVWINRAASAMLHSVDASPVGRPVHEVAPHAAFLEAVDAIVGAEGPIEREAVIGGRAPTALWVHAAALRNGSGLRTGSVFVFNDITAMRHLQRVRQDFVANVSHELRTPVTAIRGVADTLLDGSEHSPETAARFLEIIRRQAVHLERIVQDLLLLSKVEAQDGRLLEREPVDLAELLRNAIDVCEQRSRERRTRVDVDCPPGTTLAAHPSLLEQALVNLIDNAIKYGPEEALVTVRAERAEGSVRISVSDSGPGIGRQHLGRIFERFYRVDRGRSRDMGGTGLGLSIVRHIAEVHGGAVSVESEPGAGSIFTLTLPATPAAPTDGDSQ